AIGPPQSFKDGWHNSSIVRRSGTSGSPFLSVAISNSFKRVGSARDLLWIISLYQEHVENGVIELYFVNTEYQLADLFTKALGKDRIEFLINKLGMRSFMPETLKQLMDEVDE
nr:ribonuclease H [Tanacetum cinerariifolium]